MLGQQVAPNHNHGRERLLSPGASSAPPVSSGTRGLDQLREAQRLAADTETVGQGILGQLSHQRGQIEGAIDSRDDAQANLSLSNRLITRMSNRAKWMKCSLCMIVIFLIGSLGFIVYYKWLAPHHSPHPSPTPPSPQPQHPPPPSSPPKQLFEALAQGVDAAAAEGGRRLEQQQQQQQQWGGAAALAGLERAAGGSVAAVDGRALSEMTAGDIGPGIIILLIFGILALFACCIAAPKQSIVARMAVYSGAGLCYLTLALVLLLMPRDTGVVDDTLVSWSNFMRIAILVVLGVFLVLGGVLVLVSHTIKRQTAPMVIAFENEDTVRLAKP